jgi:hypothetical protein
MIYHQLTLSIGNFSGIPNGFTLNEIESNDFKKFYKKPNEIDFENFRNTTRYNDQKDNILSFLGNDAGKHTWFVQTHNMFCDLGEVIGLRCGKSLYKGIIFKDKDDEIKYKKILTSSMIKHFGKMDEKIQEEFSLYTESVKNNIEMLAELNNVLENEI